MLANITELEKRPESFIANNNCVGYKKSSTIKEIAAPQIFYSVSSFFSIFRQTAPKSTTFHIQTVRHNLSTPMEIDKKLNILPLT